MHKSAVFPFLLFLFFTRLLCAQTGQIAVPRIELMPNLPGPYNVRDWRQVALRYDSFVYDMQKTGQYLPLVSLGASGVNYPQNPVFRLHTYVGTNSPLGNEAVNVLPSLVGATLVGADKSDQYGQNWLLMSQDFFNKANGENIYLNNAGASSGGDWWYDLMPNVFFYQLYDLYPNMDGEADQQFISIADRFLDAVRAMGGSDAPWEPAYMNYRAWKFKTMEPNVNGVKEPEAAGAFAWVLYNAYRQTGNPDYLKGAEWSIEFLNNWTSNPSYELQLPYGTYTAAKMNAELGTAYDVEKMLNWSFDRGDLRGWGTIVGTWGGFDVSGLVGEANDTGNDYAFQLNGVQQAAALAPMVRYDKRFARAIGKWMLNLANATRLYYPGFLPASLQDASAWSSSNDPQQVIGYEALREKWQNQSPFSTGDAVQGGWAATNLALYGSSSIGYLGSMVEKTNVDKILKLDLLKTDFFGGDAYPTFLLFNPHSTVKVVQLDAGAGPVDVYDALTETFMLQDVSGVVDLAIPANQAILVSLAPAGGTIAYDKNRMLINGVVVDFDQHAQPYSRAPRIKALAASMNPLEIGDSTSVFATVDDADSGQITYTWSVSAGAISGTGEMVSFIAPATTANAEIQLIVADPEGNSDTAKLLVSVVPEINDAPQIIDIQKSVGYVAPNGVMQLNCLASDANDDPLTYEWSGSAGIFSGNGSVVDWTAPALEGVYQLAVKVTDDEGLSVQTGISVLVKDFSTTPGNLIAHYPFSGNADDVSGNALHGQPNGAILAPGLGAAPQSAYYFNGGSQHIAVANHALLNFQDAITVSCWFKAAALPGKETFLLSHGSWQNRWKLSVTPEKHLRWTVNSLNGIADLDAEAILQTDNFYHVTATYDGSLLALYLNGALHSYKALSGKIRTTTLPFLMGQMLPDNADYNFKGVLDEVSIYDYALDPGAVEVLYQQGLTPANEPVLPEKAAFTLLPNPARDRIALRFPENSGDEMMIRVCDLTGRLLLERSGRVGASLEIDLGGWAPGYYVISVRSDRAVAVKRFVKG